MSGFRKAKAEQAALKMAMYGPPGSGKTFTALLCAEGLAKLTKKKIAVVDTEHGSDFYCQKVTERMAHPAAFEFDALYSRSIVDVRRALGELDPKEYCAAILDSVTHLWESAQAAYAGTRTSIGTLPIHAWGQIKKPYKELMTFALNSPLHFFFLGRQGNEFDTDEESGEMKKVGVKMKAETETPYEPHILIRMIPEKQKDGAVLYTAFAEKDRSGMLAGRTITNPGYETLVSPLLKLLGTSQAQMEDPEEVGVKDAEALSSASEDREMRSTITLKEFGARIALAKTRQQLEDIGKEITPALKRAMTTTDVTTLREVYRNAEKELR